MPDILVSENITGTAMEKLGSRFDVATQADLWRTPDALAQQVATARALIIRNQTQITPDLLRHATKLVVVGRAGVGLDNVDVAACTKAGVIVVSTPDQNAISVAELAIGLMIALARKIPAADADTTAGGWKRQKFYGTELYGKTLGIIGAGRIGLLTARRARAFGMRILAHDPFISPDNVFLADLDAELVSLEELLKRSNVVSCHLPATPQTIGLLDASCFALMKPGTTFINTSRGEVVNEQGLLQALQSGTLAGAALDVRSTEPPVLAELEKLPNVLLTPHIAALTHEAQERVTRAICDDVTRVLDGLPAMNPVVRF